MIGRIATGLVQAFLLFFVVACFLALIGEAIAAFTS